MTPKVITLFFIELGSKNKTFWNLALRICHKQTIRTRRRSPRRDRRRMRTTMQRQDNLYSKRSVVDAEPKLYDHDRSISTYRLFQTASCGCLSMPGHRQSRGPGCLKNLFPFFPSIHPRNQCADHSGLCKEFSTSRLGRPVASLFSYLQVWNPYLQVWNLYFQV